MGSASKRKWNEERHGGRTGTVHTGMTVDPAVGSIPVVRIPAVYHVGTMDPRECGTHGDYEGPCLSVSRCPDAWRRIARLGNAPEHRLLKGDGMFLDILTLKKVPRLLDDVLDWGGRNGWCRTASIWRAHVEDAETGDTLLLDSPGFQEALTDADGDRDAVSRVEVPVATGRLNELFPALSACDDATDAVILAWAMHNPDVADRLDGVWWAERYDPDALSAPRGGIFPDRLGQWRRTHAPPDAGDDERPLPGTPLAIRLPPEPVGEPEAQEARP